MVNSDKYNRANKTKLLKRLETETQIEDPKTYTAQKLSGIKLFFKNNKSKLGIFSLVVFVLVGLVILAFDKEQIVSSDYEYIGTLMPQSEVLGVNTSLYMGTPTKRYECLNESELPEISAEAYMVLFSDNFQIAISKEADKPVAFASIAKLLGALVSIDYYNLDQILRLKESVDTMWSGLDLEVGEGASVEALLGASLVGSRNDAMFTLAQNYPDGVEGFVKAMNEKALLLGMNSTVIKNPVGYDDDEQVSTANDLAILAISAMKNQEIRDLVSRGYYQVVTTQDRVVDIWSTNLLLGEVEGVIGLKTGFTDKAGECLITYVDDDRDFAVIVLHSEDRIEDSKMLIDWARTNCN